MTKSFTQRKINLENEYVSADFICLSFPKCGRTWLRYVLGHYFHLAYGVNDTHRLNSTKRDKMQERKNKGCPLVSFTHDIHSFTSEIKDPEISNFFNQSKFVFEKNYVRKPVIFLMRDPIDASISFYHMMKNQNKIFNGDIERWFDDKIFGLESTLHWYKLCFDTYKKHKNKIVLHYEHLKQNNGWMNLVSFTCNTINNDDLNKSLEKRNFEKIKKKEMEEKNITDPNSNDLFFRKAGSNYQNELPKNLQARFDNDKQLKEIRQCVASMV